MYGSIEIKSATTILQGMVNFVVSRTSLSDLLPASMLTQILKAAARSDESIYLQIAKIPNIFSILRAKGEDLSLRAYDYNTEREAAQFATGAGYFTRTNAVATPLTIPVGTEVSTPSGLKFVTTTATTIPGAATQSGSVGLIAALPGAAYNVSTGAVSQVVTAFEGPEAEGLVFTNTAPTQDGDDEESDQDLRARLVSIAASLNRTSPIAVPARARLIELSTGQRVQSAVLVEDPSAPGTATLYIDDGTGTVVVAESYVDEVLIASATGGETRFMLQNPPVALDALGNPVCTLVLNTVTTLVYGADWHMISGTSQIVLDSGAFPTGLAATDNLKASYTAWGGLIREVQYDLNGRLSDPALYPGGFAGGGHLVVRAPDLYKPAITVRPTIAQGYDATTVKTAVQDALLLHINSLGIGGDVILAELYDVAMEVDGVTNFIVQSPAPADPAPDIVVADNQIVRLTAADLTVV